MRRSRLAPAALALATATLLAAGAGGCARNWRKAADPAPVTPPRTSAAADPAASAASAAPSGDSSAAGSPAPEASASAGASPSGSSAPSAPSAPGTTVAVTSVDPYGPVLQDGQGHALYVFGGDRSTTSTCTDDCATVWPALTTTGDPVAGQGADQGLLGTSRRGDGSLQVLYNGRPLYRYSGDASPSDTSGQGVHQYGAGWSLADASGHSVEGGGG